MWGIGGGGGGEDDDGGGDADHSAAMPWMRWQADGLDVQREHKELAEWREKSFTNAMFEAYYRRQGLLEDEHEESKKAKRSEMDKASAELAASLSDEFSKLAESKGQLEEKKKEVAQQQAELGARPTLLVLLL